jgi:hypothetical protein
MKNNIDFYQHYANADQHPKFKMLRVEYGWEGEGKFWALNNRIAQAENCELNISKKYNRAALASDLDFNLEGFDSFIQFLRDDCELVRECGERVITTDIVKENLQKVMVNREKARDRKKRALEKVCEGSGELEESSGEQSKKVKESKGKENNIPPKRKLKKKPQIPLPDDYQLSERHIKYADLKGMSYEAIQSEFEGFCIHHRKKGSTMASWYAAWQTWVRNYFEFGRDKKQAQSGNLQEVGDNPYA